MGLEPLSEVRRCLLLETPLALRLLVFLVQALRQRLMLPVLLALGPSTGQVQPVLEFQELGQVPELSERLRSVLEHLVQWLALAVPGSRRQLPSLECSPW